MILLCPDKENLRIWRGCIFFLFLWLYYIHQWTFITPGWIHLWKKEYWWGWILCKWLGVDVCISISWETLCVFSANEKETA